MSDCCVASTGWVLPAVNGRCAVDEVAPYLPAVAAAGRWESRGREGSAWGRFLFVCFTVTDLYILVVDQVCPSLFSLGKQDSRFLSCIVQSLSGSSCAWFGVGLPPGSVCTGQGTGVLT